MASSGTYTKTIRTGYQLKLIWEETSQSVANNTSTISVKVQLVSTGSSYTINSSASKSGTLKVNGTSYSFTFSAALSGNQTKTIYSKSVIVSHNADGTKSCAFEANAGINVTLSGTYYGTVTVSGTGTFDTIPRASKPTLSASKITMGNSVTITTNRASSAFTHVLTYAFGSLSGTIASSVGASYSWTIPLSLANAIPSNTSGTGTITCKTYNGSTLIGTASVSFTATVPTSVVPTISSVSISEAVSGIAAKFGGYVQHKSKLAVAITAAGAYSSTISKYETYIQSVAYSGRTFTSNVITTSGTIAVKTTVTDSRGRTATVTNNVSILAYYLPKITTFNAFRCDANGNEDPDGTRLKVELNFSIATVNNLNDKYYEVVYRVKDSNNSWGAIASGNIYSRNDSFVSAAVFDTDKMYDLALQLYDYFNGTRVELDISTAFTLIDFKANGQGIAFGKVAETDDLMDINFPILARQGINYPNKVLWQGAYYMHGTQTISLSENITDQASGIVLIFSRYQSGAAQNQNFHSFFVPKKFVELHNGGGKGFIMGSSDFSVMASKYLYISDDSISGYEKNDDTGTGASGITFTNNQFVLRYVIGV